MNTESMTLAQALERANAQRLPGAEDAALFFEGAPMTPFKPVVDDDGSLFTLCGGYALFGSYLATRDIGRSGCCYIVHDDSELRAWYARGGLQGNRGQSAPRTVLRVVISA